MFYKAIFVLHGDLQEEHIDFNPEGLFGPIASHETIPLLIQHTAKECLDVDGCDVDKTYLFGDLDIPIRMRQTAKSSKIVSNPGYDVLLLIKSFYGARQAGHIWGNQVHKKLVMMRFKQSRFDPRLYTLHIKNS